MSEQSISEEMLTTLGVSQATPRQIEAINALIIGKVPAHAVTYRKGRAGKTFAYVQHRYANDLIRDAFGTLWSYEVLDTRAYDDSSASARVCLTLHIPQEDGSYLEIRTTAVGAHEDTSGKMCKAFMVASAASRGLVKTLFRRFGLGNEFYEDEVEMGPKEAWTALWRFAQRKDPTVEQDSVTEALKEAGITGGNLLDRFEQAYSIVSQVVSVQPEDIPETLSVAEKEPPPEEAGSGMASLINIAEEELGAQAISATAKTGKQKVNFVKLYAYAEQEFGFSSEETKAVLLTKFGQEWFFEDKVKIKRALQEAANAS